MLKNLVGTAAIALALVGCSSNRYDAAWIYTGDLVKPTAVIVTLNDFKSHETASYVHRPTADNGNQCVIHMPSPESAWRMSEDQWYADWLKEANLCTKDVTAEAGSGGFVPDGNSLEGTRVHALSGQWDHVSNEVDRLSALAKSWGAPTPPAGVIGPYQEPQAHWAGFGDTDYYQN